MGQGPRLQPGGGHLRLWHAGAHRRDLHARAQGQLRGAQGHRVGPGLQDHAHPHRRRPRDLRPGTLRCDRRLGLAHRLPRRPAAVHPPCGAVQEPDGVRLARAAQPGGGRGHGHYHPRPDRRPGSPAVAPGQAVHQHPGGLPGVGRHLPAGAHGLSRLSPPGEPLSPGPGAAHSFGGAVPGDIPVHQADPRLHRLHRPLVQRRHLRPQGG